MTTECLISIHRIHSTEEARSIGPYLARCTHFGDRSVEEFRNDTDPSWSMISYVGFGGPRFRVFACDSFMTEAEREIYWQQLNEQMLKD
jgi:hypothetical protein